MHTDAELGAASRKPLNNQPDIFDYYGIRFFEVAQAGCNHAGVRR